ncbi:oligoribonuclease NrnB/cAMP/cGMP phosphodiesterase (DHH superfamily) [Bacillus sp. SORGH_AS 510]|uniref:DHH family phosphoesterase n=1 Tax=Bacillus sp. SORGH_AS_0510 TaxID=3041771 RepID=UPI002785A20B|nr:oligoribonuclease [Bacillus sp. SORGH_AS_0510]MDQ1145526.1 oligoribonuclease NrnB/cAMP/cGMP phosphodiesterase (DHH superfamily) [Bacillus sp. SORGH_AS_0510]
MVKLFTDIDLDGLGCGLLARIAFGEKVNVYYCSYRNLNKRVETVITNSVNAEEKIFITDLAVNEDIEKRLNERFQKGKHVQMIDHHVTAMHFNQYEWAYVNPEYDTGNLTCATSLFYDFLIENRMIERTKALEEFIELVRQYDTWEWDQNNNVLAKRLNDLFYILNREKFEEEMLKRLMENKDTFMLTETENLLLDIEDQKINRYIHSKSRQIVQTFVDDYCVGIVHAEQYLSELGNALNNLYPHLDMIVLLNVSGKKMGFRTIHDEVNVAKFAKRYGGGGHPKASGAELTAEAFKLYVENVFDFMPLKPDSDRNEYNVKNSIFITSYQNSQGESSYVIPLDENQFSIIHNGKKLEETFTTFAEAERYIKRNYSSWLWYDQEYLKFLSNALGVSLEEIKENFEEIISNRIMDVIGQ